MFYIFNKACKKYKFVFSLSTYRELTLTLRPINTFENIIVKQGYYERSYSKLFLKAIKEMKMYRNGGGD